MGVDYTMYATLSLLYQIHGPGCNQQIAAAWLPTRLRPGAMPSLSSTFGLMFSNESERRHTSRVLSKSENCVKITHVGFQTFGFESLNAPLWLRLRQLKVAHA